MRKRAAWAALVAAGVGLALLITLFSPFASSSPDGLNKVAQDKGFHQAEKGPSYEIIPGYSLPGIDNPHLANNRGPDRNRDRAGGWLRYAARRSLARCRAAPVQRVRHNPFRRGGAHLRWRRSSPASAITMATGCSTASTRG